MYLQSHSITYDVDMEKFTSCSWTYFWDTGICSLIDGKHHFEKVTAAFCFIKALEFGRLVSFTGKCNGKNCQSETKVRMRRWLPEVARKQVLERANMLERMQK
jgi:hypothetical protein